MRQVYLFMCPNCEGMGQHPFRENFVTREMALDAGEPSMEGQSMGVEFIACQRCQATGRIEFVAVDELKDDEQMRPKP